MDTIKRSVLAGIAFGFLYGIYLAFSRDVYHALILGPILGVAFAVTTYLFMTSKIVKQQTQIADLDDKDILRSAGANHFKNGEAVGGKLYLMSDKLAFKSHRFNIQNHALTIAIVQIKEVRFYNTLGVIPNGLVVTLLDGQTEKFVVANRKHWKEDIEKLTTH